MCVRLDHRTVLLALAEVLSRAARDLLFFPEKGYLSMDLFQSTVAKLDLRPGNDGRSTALRPCAERYRTSTDPGATKSKHGFN